MKLIAKTRFLNAMSGDILDPKDEFEVKTQADVDYFVGHGLAELVKEKEEKAKPETKEDKTKIKTK